MELLVRTEAQAAINLFCALGIEQIQVHLTEGVTHLGNDADQEAVLVVAVEKADGVEDVIEKAELEAIKAKAELADTLKAEKERQEQRHVMKRRSSDD